MLWKHHSGKGWQCPRCGVYRNARDVDEHENWHRWASTYITESIDRQFILGETKMSALKFYTQSDVPGAQSGFVKFERSYKYPGKVAVAIHSAGEARMSDFIILDREQLLSLKAELIRYLNISAPIRGVNPHPKVDGSL